ncbi:NAD(P)-binding protein [Microthyrium microscopicum]|uniref:NAD(P)-binding protein n=1 Tax=Microthyrium microscopicum TaxID=703497 RepID=A0A6A6TU32_9PEZI|nr:NAD(P)-binding protein [Microthyrium microscopicum]
MTSESVRLRPQDLKDKVAVITGASRGIGRAIAVNLASRGCSILGTCSNDASLHHFTELENQVEQLYSINGRSYNSEITGIVADIHDSRCATTIYNALCHSDRHRLRQARGTGRCTPKVDIVVHNATDANPGVVGELTVDEIQKSLVGNVQTPVLIIEKLVRQKCFNPESRIIYISSIRSRKPWFDQLMYSAGKSAGESLCRSWADAFGGKYDTYAFMAGTTANAVAVGLTETGSILQCPPEMIETFKNEFIPMQSMPRMGQPEDVADVVGMLCGHDARWITGSVISASGGGVMMQ